MHTRSKKHWWAKAKFLGKTRKAEVDIRLVHAQLKPKKGNFHIVYGPFKTQEMARDYLGYHGYKRREV